MDHAQEVGLWKAVGELEGEIALLDEAMEKLQAEHAEIREHHITMPRAMLFAGTAFFAGMIVANACLQRGPQPVLRPSIIEAADPRVIELTLRCPAGWEGRCREAAEAARRVVEAR